MNSKIILARGIKLDRNYVNTLNYTEEQMLTLCQQNAVAAAENYSFLRETGSIFVGFTYSQCLQSNYIAFQNPDYSNKWFYAWIDEVIYKGNKNCELKFTVDAWATWFGSLSVQKCFIERQHVTDDTIGLHTIPENLDVGQIVSDWQETDSTFGSTNSYWFVIASNYNPR